MWVIIARSSLLSSSQDFTSLSQALQISGVPVPVYFLRLHVAAKGHKRNCSKASVRLFSLITASVTSYRAGKGEGNLYPKTKRAAPKLRQTIDTSYTRNVIDLSRLPLHHVDGINKCDATTPTNKRLHYTHTTPPSQLVPCPATGTVLVCRYGYFTVQFPSQAR